MKLSPRFFFFLAAFTSSLLGHAAALEPAALQCEYRVNPQGIDEPHPRLTWQVRSDQRGAKQTAYQILVASSAERLAQNSGDLWDSGQVASDRTVNIAYAGKPLDSRQPYFWKVRVWDGDGQARWSEAAFWTMGLLQPTDWQADYISFRDASPLWTNRNKLFLPPAHQYRKEFSADKKIRRHGLRDSVGHL